MLEALYECVARPTHLPRLQGVTYLARRRELAARGAPERPLNAEQLGPCGFSKQGEIMPENEQSPELLEHTTKIVAAHVANNAMPAADLPRLIATVHETVSPESSCRLIMLNNFGYRAMLLPYEPCTFFRDQFPDGRVPLPTFPTA